MYGKSRGRCMKEDKPPLTAEDLQFHIAKEIGIFLAEHREEITKRALKRLREIRKEAEKNEPET